MKSINLIYWNSSNFGDLLSPFIIESISGIKPYYKYSGKRWWTELVHRILELDFNNIPHILYPWNRSLIAVGSVIGWGNERSTVWGAGLLRRDESVKVGKIYAVRGEYTAQALAELGYKVPKVYGDPAILLPLIYRKSVKQEKGKIAIIPNWEEVDYFKERYSSLYTIIDLRTDDIYGVIDEICSCEYILSTSLHGLIVAHTYGIKALWIKKGDIQTDGIKFKDYFSSVGIECYKAFLDFSTILQSKSNVFSLFADYDSVALPTKECLESIRRGLLCATPFPVNTVFEKYKQ